MVQGSTDDLLSDQLLQIALDPELRSRIYEHLGEYCHQCRNRLNSLKLSLYLAVRSSTEESAGLWSEVESHYEELERRVDRLQMLCRPLSLSKVTLGLELLIDDRREAWLLTMRSGGRNLELIAPVRPDQVSFDVEQLGQALDSLVNWRASVGSGSSTAAFRWWVDAGSAHLAWDEDGKSDQAVGSVPVDSASRWTLPLLARVIRAHQGELIVKEDEGWSLQVSWPSQPHSP